ncbi:unnamed protein product [Penicillium camemberti]|uniref:Str. FM013 n=1 Tax=Penicillium camemberti (strain FM 013) TaxID=1429867 RepID=A0A0G4NVQ5_PENC3|nr:unnamed protein product [Penicillium camemberti]
MERMPRSHTGLGYSFWMVMDMGYLMGYRLYQMYNFDDFLLMTSRGVQIHQVLLN